MPAIRKIQLDFSQCPGVESMAGFVDGLKLTILQLTGLQLNLEGTSVSQEDARRLWNVINESDVKVANLDIRLSNGIGDFLSCYPRISGR